MGKGRRDVEAQGRKITMKMARSALQLTVDGKQHVSLSNMDIVTFPRCLLKLSDVAELDLSRNRLRTLPDGVGRFVNLRRLDLHSNQLEALPSTIGLLRGLVYLNLCNNRLSAAGLPDEVCQLSRLRSLNLGLNRLETLPHAVASLKELRELGLFDNLLTQVPPYVGNLPHLRKLNVGRNPICRPGDAEDPDPIRRVRCFYLVDGEYLCKSCLGRCQAERQRLEGLGSGGTRSLSGSALSGLATPYSVAHDGCEQER